MQTEDLNQIKSPRVRAFVSKVVTQKNGLEFADYKILGVTLLLLLVAMQVVDFIWFGLRLHLKAPSVMAEHPYVSFYAFMFLTLYGAAKLTPVYLRHRRRQINESRQGGPTS